MKVGDLVRVSFINPYGVPSHRVGILLEVHQNDAGKHSRAMMLDSSGNLFRIFSGGSRVVEVISEGR